MAKVIVIHSFRRATGKSSLAANLSYVLARRGKRVGAFDADFQAPGLHLFFGLADSEIKCSLNSFLMEECAVVDAAYDVTERLSLRHPAALLTFTASSSASDILHMLRSPFKCDKINEGLMAAQAAFQLDYLIVDTTAGLNEDTLSTIALADTLFLILRPDQQDYQGTAVTVEVARNLGMIDLQLVLNETPENLDTTQAYNTLQETYNCPVAVIMPHSQAMMTLAGRKLISIEQPGDPYAMQVKKLADLLS